MVAGWLRELRIRCSSADFMVMFRLVKVCLNMFWIVFNNTENILVDDFPYDSFVIFFFGTLECLVFVEWFENGFVPGTFQWLVIVGDVEQVKACRISLLDVFFWYLVDALASLS